MERKGKKNRGGKKQLVSVIIPVKNGEKTIDKTINSVLNQSYKNFEFIVIDDCSTDKTLEILKSYGKKIKVIKNKKNLGPAASRNKGIGKAKGEIIFFTDADCEVPKNWISGILREYKQGIAGVGGYLKPGKDNWVAKLELIQNRFLLGIKNKRIVNGKKTPMGYTNNVSYRKKVLEEVRGFDEKFPSPAGEDIDLKKRICEKDWKVVYIPAPVLHLENYDFEYLLKRIFAKALNKNPKKSVFINSLICFFGLPLIVLNVLRKIIEYKLKKVL